MPDRAEVALLKAIAGSDAGALDECVRTGMLVVDSVTVRFRHELARMAVEAHVPAGRRLGLHADILAHLAGVPDADPARLAYHAEAAADAAAVLRYAPGRR